MTVARLCRERRTSVALLQVEAIELHHLGPRVDEVAYHLLLSIDGGVDLSDGAKLGGSRERLRVWLGLRAVWGPLVVGDSAR